MGRHQALKICHLISGDLWAGAEVQAFTLLTTLHGMAGFEVSAIVLNEGALSEKLKHSGVSVSVLEESRNRFPTILRKATQILSVARPDIIHTHRYKENLLGALLKRRGLCRYLIQTVHGSPERMGGVKGLKGGLYTAINRFLTRRYNDLVHCVSYDIERQLTGYFNPPRLVTIHNAVNVSELRPGRSSDVVRAELGLSDSAPVIGSAGRLMPVKGYDLLLQAASQLRPSFPNLRVLLVGDGPLRSDLERLSENLGLRDAVMFTGFRRDVLDILNCLDLFVVSSHHEGIPTVALEAMGLGKPVVSFEVGGMPEIIEPDRSGLLVPAGNANALADACRELLADPSRRRSMGEAAKERIAAEFSHVVQAEKIAALYCELMKTS